MTSESLLTKEGLAGGLGQRSENSLQIAVLSGSTEHLPAPEGLDKRRSKGAACANSAVHENPLVLKRDRLLNPV